MVYELQSMLSNFQESGNVELNPQAALDYLEREEARLTEKNDSGCYENATPVS